MGSANKHHYANSTTPTKLLLLNPTTSSDSEDQHLNPNPNANNSSPNQQIETESMVPFTIDGAEEDLILSKSEFLTREEVVKRRYRRLKLDIQVYEDYYWALMEDYRVKHREYYWNYGKSPFKEEEDEVEKKERSRDENGNFIEVTDENGKLGLGFTENGGCGGGGSSSGKNNRCAYNGCKSKVMVLTNYCHPHILSDTKQKLYKACNYIIKSPQTGPIHCGKPILRATVPSLCSVHFEKAQIHVTRALKKAGLNISSASKLAPKLHVIVAESVRQINTKRRERRSNVGNDVAKEENTNVGNDVAKEESAS